MFTTDVPGCRETVINGVNGILVPPRDSSALAFAMIDLITMPRYNRHMAPLAYLWHVVHDVHKVTLKFTRH